MLKIIPVIDVKNGQAVHARGGNRAHYRPVQSILHEGSDPIGLATAFRDRLMLSELYLADLDAIAGSPPNLPLYQALSGLDLALWVDCGIRSCELVPSLQKAGVKVVIAGLETVESPADLGRIVRDASVKSVAFSLDLRDGQPLVNTSNSWGTNDPMRLTEIAIEAGVTRLILLDLARVGTGAGTGTSPLLQAIRKAHPTIELIAGGGIANAADVQTLQYAGANAVLVGSALHDGRIR